MNEISASMSRLDFDTKVPSLTVSFRIDLARVQLWELIGKYKMPEVIFWYIGANGFRQPGVAYYREDFQMIANLGNESRCSLYDLSAWGGLRKKQVSLDSVNPNVTRINDFGIKWIRAFPSSEFFSWLKTPQTAEIGQYLKETVFKRQWIFDRSKEVETVNINIGEVFEENCPLLEPFYKNDCAKMYSALQYIEGLYLIDKVVDEALASGRTEIDLIIALPNNEWQYYLDDNQSFEEDIRAILRMKKIETLQLNIEFCFFKYGKKTSFRPYNSIGAIVQEIKKEDIL